MIETGANLGFAAGCNRGAAAARGRAARLAQPRRGARAGLARGDRARRSPTGRGWAAWQALVTAERRTDVNTRGGVVHFTGIAWAGGAGEPVGRRRPPDRASPAFVSGACLAIRARALRASWAASRRSSSSTTRTSTSRCACGWPAARSGVEPAARVDHDYEFDKGPAKWRYLERNRWATLIRTYPGGAAGAARARAARDRAGAARRRRGRRLAAAEAARLGRDARARCRGCCASAARSRRRARDRRRRVRRARSPPSSTRPTSARRGALARARRASCGAYWARRARRSLGARRALRRRCRSAPRRAPTPQLLLEARDLLGEDLRLLGEARGGDREVEQQEEDDAEGEDEDRVRRLLDAHQVGDRVEAAGPDREHQQRRRRRTSRAARSARRGAGGGRGRGRAGTAPRVTIRATICALVSSPELSSSSSASAAARRRRVASIDGHPRVRRAPRRRRSG